MIEPTFPDSPIDQAEPSFDFVLSPWRRTELAWRLMAASADQKLDRAREAFAAAGIAWPSPAEVEVVLIRRRHGLPTLTFADLFAALAKILKPNNRSTK